MKKTLLCSVNALCDKNGNFNSELEKVIIKISKEYNIVIYSGDIMKINLLPISLRGYFLEVERSDVRNGNLIKNMFIGTKTTRRDYIILGSTDNDFFLAKQSNVMLLAAFWSLMDERIEKYGMRIKSGAVLDYFFDNILTIEEPCYYKVAINEKSMIYSLMSANTRYTKNKTKVEINNYFNELLKSGNKNFIQLIKYYFICSLNIIDDIYNVDIWTYYPSSDSSDNEILDEFVETARYLFGSTRKKHPLFIRHRTSEKRHYLSSADRLKLACSSQFDTIHLNEKFKSNIKDKIICIIDDYTTYGSSCETTRILLEKAGAKKVIFITFGKFGYSDNYNLFNYDISGDVFKKDYSYSLIDSSVIKGKTIDNSDKIIDILEVMI